MAKLNGVKGVAVKTAKTSAKEVASVIVENLGVAEYNAAADNLKEAQVAMELLAPDLMAEGLSYVFQHNCDYRDDTKNQIKSVKLTELQADGTTEAVRFTFSSRAGKISEEAVTAHFQGLQRLDGTPVNVNNYAEWLIGAEFDKKVFLDARGRFDQKRFDKFKAAIQGVAEELGVENPLSFFKEFKATKEVNDLRFQELSPVQNLKLHMVLPMATSLEPIRSKEETE